MLWLTFVSGDPGQAAAIRISRFVVYFAFAGALMCSVLTSYAALQRLVDRVDRDVPVTRERRHRRDLGEPALLHPAPHARDALPHARGRHLLPGRERLLQLDALLLVVAAQREDAPVRPAPCGVHRQCHGQPGHEIEAVLCE